ncbi:MAG: hypothetical protein H5T86_07595 [Armatimonadetes bacterium]|nr:hypothetical protein [Armatimonadota bacterium]
MGGRAKQDEERVVFLHLQPGLDDGTSLAVAAGLADAYGAVVRQGQPLAVPAEAFDSARGQYNARVLLRAVPPPRPAALALGIVRVDLFVPGLNFVFGLASGSRALISVARLQTHDASLYRHRVATEAVHEIGHLLGLAHCPVRRCAMFFSNTLADTDAKGPGLCPRCAARAQGLAPTPPSSLNR